MSKAAAFSPWGQPPGPHRRGEHTAGLMNRVKWDEGSTGYRAHRAQRTLLPSVGQRGPGRVALGRKAAAFRLPNLLLSVHDVGEVDDDGLAAHALVGNQVQGGVGH